MYDSPRVNYISNFLSNKCKSFPTNGCAFHWGCPVTANDSWYAPIRFMIHVPFKPF